MKLQWLNMFPLFQMIHRINCSIVSPSSTFPIPFCESGDSYDDGGRTLPATGNSICGGRLPQIEGKWVLIFVYKQSSGSGNCRRLTSGEKIFRGNNLLLFLVSFETPRGTATWILSPQKLSLSNWLLLMDPESDGSWFPSTSLAESLNISEWKAVFQVS